MLPEAKKILKTLQGNYNASQDKEAFLLNIEKKPRPPSGKPPNFGKEHTKPKPLPSILHTLKNPQK